MNKTDKQTKQNKNRQVKITTKKKSNEKNRKKYSQCLNAIRNLATYHYECPPKILLVLKRLQYTRAMFVCGSTSSRISISMLMVGGLFLFG